MTTQATVADAFFAGESQPQSASNFRMHTFDGGLTAYLVSDESLVLATREPMEQYVVYGITPNYLTFHDLPVSRTTQIEALQRQHRRVGGRVRMSEHGRGEIVVSEEPRPVTDFDDLEHLHP